MIASEAFHFYTAHLSDGDQDKNQPFYSKCLSIFSPSPASNTKIIAFVIRRMQQANRPEGTAYRRSGTALGL
jgi:hypothetical protein